MSQKDNKKAPKQRNDMRTRSDAVTTKNVDMASMWEKAFHTYKSAQDIPHFARLNDELKTAKLSEQKWMDKVKQLENNSERGKSAQDGSLGTLQPAKEEEIKTLQGELKTKGQTITDLQSKLQKAEAELEEKRKQHIENRDKSAQDIACLNGKLEIAKTQSIRRIYGLKAELKTAWMKSTREIYELKAELEIVRLSEQKWMDKVKQLEKNSERSKSAQDGRPDIQDLSDSNRPSKLAERFSELYDDEWTNCYDTARKQFSTEQSAVQMLLRTCVKIYNSCTFIASKDVHDLQRAFSTFSEAQDDILLIQIKQRRKRTRQVDIDLKRITPGIGDSVADMLGPDLIKNQHVRAFWVKCLEICWLLVIQEPPVYMDTEINKQGQMFDHAAYRPYTQTGYEFDYVVWPALYTHQGGDILYKGVAQGRDSSDSVGGKRRSSLVKK